MPNQSDPNSNKPIGGQLPNQPTVPVASIQPDLPPLPPDFQSVEPIVPVIAQADNPSNQPTDTSPHADGATNTSHAMGSATSSDLSSVMSTKPKKKFGTGRIIATILGVLVLIVGVGTGIVAISNPVLYQSFARKPISRWREIGNPKARQAAERAYKEQLASQASRIDVHSNCPDGSLEGCSSYNTNATLPNRTGGYSRAEVLNVLAPIDSNLAGAYCSGGKCPQEPDTDIAGYYISKETGQYYPIDITVDVPEGDDSPDSPSTPLPTATPSTSAQCLNVKAYNTEWALLSTQQLTQLHSGDSVNFCVSGSSSSGIFDKAQFWVTGVLQPETTSKRPGSDDFCQPVGITNLTTIVNVKARIHHATLNQWFGETLE